MRVVLIIATNVIMTIKILLLLLVVVAVAVTAAAAAIVFNAQAPWGNSICHLSSQFNFMIEYSWSLNCAILKMILVHCGLSSWHKTHLPE